MSRRGKNLEKRTCMFQAYRVGYWYCEHPKNDIYNLRCNRDTVCTHRESTRDMECDIAKTYLYLNIDRVINDRVKYCRYGEGCKKDKVCPECSKNGIINWAEKYKKDFEVIG